MDPWTDDLPAERLRNIGAVAGRQLRAVGIATLAELRSRGAAGAWRQARCAVAGGSLNALYAYHAALLDLPWREITSDMRAAWRRDAETEEPMP